MSQASILGLLVNEVRPKTIRLLEVAADHELLWTPPHTQNHILWHAGHALWLGDVLCLGHITGRTELPTGWARTFGMSCIPPAQTMAWPDKRDVLDLLRRQKLRLLDEIGSLSNERLLGQNPAGSAQLARQIIHGLHDEANHQGEMYLLLKLQRAPR
jgi:DinB superfamily